MAKNTRQTGAAAASAAGRTLRSPAATPTQRRAAASTLSQTPKRGR